MELKDFVVLAVTSITEAVVEADEAIKEKGGMVNPGTHKHDGQKNTDFVRPRTTLNFDIAISTSEKNSSQAKAGGKIFVVEAKLGGDSESKNESISRLTFSLDVALPSDPHQERRIGSVRSPQSK